MGKKSNDVVEQVGKKLTLSEKYIPLLHFNYDKIKPDKGRNHIGILESYIFPHKAYYFKQTNILDTPTRNLYTRGGQHTALRLHAVSKQFMCSPSEKKQDEYYVYLARVVGGACDKNHNSFLAHHCSIPPVVNLHIDLH